MCFAMDVDKLREQLLCPEPQLSTTKRHGIIYFMSQDSHSEFDPVSGNERGTDKDALTGSRLEKPLFAQT